MKRLSPSLARRQASLRAGMVAIACVAAAAAAQAQVTLHDGNSTATINPGSQAGMNHWDIQGQNQLQQEWFWVGVGPNPVRSLDTFGAPNINPISPNEVVLTYVNPGLFSVSVDYLLTGGSVMAPGQNANADMGESIRIHNLSTAPLSLHFYGYTYFNLGGASQDTVNLGQNSFGQYNEATQQSPGVALSEMVNTPGANEGEVAPVVSGGGTLAKLNSGGPVTLGPYSGPVGPGAVSWALQWDFNIAGGGTALVSKDNSLDVIVVPEPSTLGLLGLGLAALVMRKQNRAK